MSDHTEGPWKVSRRFDIYSDRGPLVGGTYIGTTRGNGELPKSVELTDEANARLIAAAPDLFIACEMLKQWFDYGGDAPEMLDDCVNAAAEAIKKVKVIK